MIQQLLTLVVLTNAFWFAVLTANAVPPTDNPVASYYATDPLGYPAWTDSIEWANVIDMKTYATGRTEFEKFENARDELAEKGGGVLYYPAGIYDFTSGPFDGPKGRGLMLKSGVVIRGEAPTELIDPRQGKLPLRTKFLFPFQNRSDVAFDTGTRARFWLRGASPKEPTARTGKSRDIYVSIGIKDGQWQGADLLIALTTAYTNGVSKITATGNVITISLTADLPGKNSPSNFSADLVVSQLGNSLTGSYTSTVGSIQTKGEMEGRIGTVTPEVPRDWNLIGLQPSQAGRIKDVNNVGICWVHTVGATVYFGPDLLWGETWKTAGSWKSNFVQPTWADRRPDGTHPLDPFCGGGQEYIGAGHGRLVFGCYFDQAVQINNAMNCGVSHHSASAADKNGFGPQGFHTHKFGPRIGVYGSRVLVAANVVPLSDGRNFKYRQTTFSQGNGLRESTILFDYNRACGLDVNKDLLGLVRASIKAPASNKGYYEEGVVVRDNDIYNYGHKGYNISGRWVTITSNRNERMVLREELNPYLLGPYRLVLDGFVEVTGEGNGWLSDTLSRAFDLSGQNLWVDGNWYHNLGSAGNDGEGILSQSHGGTELYSWAVTHNLHQQGIGQSSYIGGWTVRVHGCLIAWNETAGWVGQAGPLDEFDAAYLANKAANTRCGKNSTALLVAPTGKPIAPQNVKTAIYGNDAIEVSYRNAIVKDKSLNEIGFRIQRSSDQGKTWNTIAYRPQQIQQHPDNPPVWVDFLAPTGIPLIYRVVAISSDDTDAAASVPTSPITLTKP